MEVRNPGGGSQLIVGEIRVFDGNSPNAWTDLDLSAAIGAFSSLVLLKVNSPTAGQVVAFRKNGDTDEQLGDWDMNGGAGYFYGEQLIFKIAVVVTDPAGIVEWRCSAITANTTVDIIAFLN